MLKRMAPVRHLDYTLRGKGIAPHWFERRRETVRSPAASIIVARAFLFECPDSPCGVLITANQPGPLS